MTTYHSSYLSDEDVEKLLASIEEEAYRSKIDGCRVVLFYCVGCARSFEEEVEAAKAKMISGVKPLCLTCDAESEDSSFAAIVFQVGMYGG